MSPAFSRAPDTSSPEPPASKQPAPDAGFLCLPGLQDFQDITLASSPGDNRYPIFNNLGY